ncbi:hypothetical protein AJ80_00842 [Polytolypa hystricis UAMH7299]|uniref:Zn(2)-C6 fungal-type domain-containing protein n=1 Tax=Polytolypa hystricis (strain UAMH7299) TaxID=1447883 RepID=A0A2B7YTK0_POLH7|nr:hypothetical protein AJ80_00842 [Polytolypa hystricis UAMH7299]
MFQITQELTAKAADSDVAFRRATPPIFARSISDAMNDTLRRHIRQNHNASINSPSRARKACANCRVKKSRCEGGSPCSQCSRLKIHCSLNDQDSDDAGDCDTDSESMDTNLESVELQQKPHLQQGSSGTESVSEKIERYINLYFELFQHHWLHFIHKGTFDANNEPPLLVHSMVVIGLWASGEQGAQAAAVSLHGKLGLSICQQKEKWDASQAEEACNTCSWPIPTYQAILLHIIFSLLSQNSAPLGLDLRPSFPRADLELLECLVGSCRKLGMFYYPNMLAHYQESGHTGYSWMCIEEAKRFNLALYRLCRALSVPDPWNKNTIDRAKLLPASELQFPMPENELSWKATNTEEWISALAEGAKDDKTDDASEETWISSSSRLLQILGL